MRPETNPGVQWYVAMRHSSRNKFDANTQGLADQIDAITEQIERHKASVRVNAEHPFRLIKRWFGDVEVRYRGLKKNTALPVSLFALSNLWMARAKLIDGAKTCLRLQHGPLTRNAAKTTLAGSNTHEPDRSITSAAGKQIQLGFTARRSSAGSGVPWRQPSPTGLT